MPSCTDTTGHTKAFIYPVMDQGGGGGGGSVLRHKADFVFIHFFILAIVGLQSRF